MKEKLKPVNWMSLLCCIVTAVIFIISSTLITAICCGICSGLFIADTIWRNVYVGDDENEENEYKYDEEEYDEEENEEY